MAAPLTLPAPPPPSDAQPATSGSFVDRVSFATVFQGLEKRGITLSDEEKEKFKEITLAQLRKHDGGVPVGNDFGTSAVNLVYVLFAFFKNLLTGGNITDTESLIAHAGNIATHTGELGKLKMLEDATIGIYRRLKAQGGNLAAAAELVSGKAVGHRPPDMAESVYRQIQDTINLPEGTSVNLSEAAQPMSGLPHAPKRPLTRG
jgi:hypothetical protein